MTWDNMPVKWTNISHRSVLNMTWDKQIVILKIMKEKVLKL